MARRRRRDDDRDRRGRRRDERWYDDEPPPQRQRRWLRPLLKWGFVLALWLGIGLVGAVSYYAYDLPTITGLEGTTRRPSVTLTDARGQIFATYGAFHAGPVFVRELPEHLINAVLATEDRRFYEHNGVDLWGIARAVWANLLAGEVRQGGSTITQQLAKNVFLTPERTLHRKIQEAMLALWLERNYGKDDLLSVYLNRVYMGAGAYGVEAAAQKYFGKSARDVDLYEAALLAGLLKAPSRYNPLSNPELAQQRATAVLAGMVDAGYLGEDRAVESAAGGGGKRRALPARHGRYFADWVMDQVGGYVGFGDRDITVTTTLELTTQRLAEAQLRDRLAKEGDKAGAGQAALVAMTPDGAVRAMVGGRDYASSQFNRATQAQRQPGSAFKLFVFLAGLEAGLAPDSAVLDAPVTVAGWTPSNYSDKYAGEVTLREAAARSINTAAVRVAEQAGRERVVQVARRLGITTPLAPHPSLTLGTSEVTLLELTAAYGALANGGDAVLPYGIAEIRDSLGKVLYRRKGSAKSRVVAARELGALDDMLGAVIAWGTGKQAKLDRPAAGKTGTSQDFRDAWFVGFTAELVAGVWVGNDDGKPMHHVTGGGMPARLWRSFMAPAHKGLAARRLPVPPDRPGVGIAKAPQPLAPAPETVVAEGREEETWGLQVNDRFLRRVQRAREEGR
jgi:penicillin-binding protein 1A